jgi:hypothetical protein
MPRLTALLSLFVAPVLATATLVASASPTTNCPLRRGALSGPTYVAAAVTEGECQAKGDVESDAWWDCVTERETERCNREGWCD